MMETLYYNNIITIIMLKLLDEKYYYNSLQLKGKVFSIYICIQITTMLKLVTSVLFQYVHIKGEELHVAVLVTTPYLI